MRRYTVRWSRRLLYLATILALILSLAPLQRLSPTARAVGAPNVPPPIVPPAPPALEQAPPVADPHLPSLGVHLVVAPDPVAVGQLATVTLTIENGAADPADDLVITLAPLAGATPQPGPGFVSAATGWRWTPPQLAGRASASVTATVLVAQVPPGDALVAQAAVTARGLGDPIRDEGGALLAPGSATPAGALAITPTAAPAVAPNATAPVSATATRATSPGAATPTAASPSPTASPTATSAPPLSAVPFIPGADAILKSADGRVEVRVPGAAATAPLSLTVARAPRPGEPAPPAVASFKRALEPFFLNADDARGQAVHRFAAPVTIVARYTPEQLRARGISADDLTLAWFDPDAGRWREVPTALDLAAHTATAQVDHFSAYTLADLSSPSDAFLPTIRSAQVGPYAGAAEYSLPLTVPAGAGGLSPKLALAYSSQATDGKEGKRDKQQAGWAGRGWSLATGSIGFRKIAFDSGVYYTLVLNGQSYELVRGMPLVANPQQNHPEDWDWNTADESFLKVRALYNGLTDGTTAPDGTGPRSVTVNNSSQRRTLWALRTKDGTRYEFSEDLWWGWDDCDVPGIGGYVLESYRWMLTRVIDTHGNQVTYGYGHDTYTPVNASTCASNASQTALATVDRDVWPTQITWGGNPTTSPATTARYMVTFAISSRMYDTQWDDNPTQQYAGTNGQSRETKRLDAVQVYSMQASAWELVRQYNLGYVGTCGTDGTCQTQDYDPYVQGWTAFSGTVYNKLTLTGLRLIGNDGTSQLPRTSFTYGPARGTSDYANADWNRLTSADNGQGGTTTFAYEQIGAAVNSSTNLSYNAFIDGGRTFVNRRRVTQRTTNDGMGHRYPTTYAYAKPALNSLGYGATGDHTDTQPNPNSAALYANKYQDTSTSAPAQGHGDELVIPAHEEFRGHAYVLETGPDGSQTEHWYYQGDISDSPDCPAVTATGGNANPGTAANPLPGTGLYADHCFQELRDREFLRGREYRTRISGPASGGSPVLQDTRHTFTVTFYGYGADNAGTRSGLWHAWVYETQMEQVACEGTIGMGNTGPCPAPAVGKTTRYAYDYANYQMQAPDGRGTTRLDQYGNVTKTSEYTEAPAGQVGALLRTTERWYDTINDFAVGGYLVDRPWQEAIRDGQGNLLALTTMLYDGHAAPGLAVGDKGDLTLSRKYFDAPPVADQPTGTTWHGNDLAYGYDVYGNRTTVTTYTTAGTRTKGTGGALGYGPAGDGSAGRTVTTAYDPTFNTFPTLVTQPTVTASGAALALTEGAGYDYRMGTLTSVTGPNGAATTVTAGYDLFGRLTSIVKPGDSPQYPTTQATYYDAAIPFRYTVVQREGAGSSGGTRPSTLTYDGLGRQIQTKRESVDGQQNIVTDTRYDGLGRAIQQSQPRYVNETPSDTFWAYTPVPAGGVNWTGTSYDGAGRALDVTLPDNTVTRTRYYTAPVGMAASVTDANGHKTRRESDLSGRLRTVIEYSGAADPYAVYATTTYAYDGRDLLTGVTDQAGNVTMIGYDSLGRKVSMADPDMGAWSYAYDPNGTLHTQTDAKGQAITFAYDALDRLTGKTYSTGYPTAYYRYDEADVTDGRGQRTTMMNANTGTRHAYDERGRQTSTTATVAGLSESRTFDWTYDSADRVSTMTYPALPGNAAREQVTYTYDAAWRQTSVHGANTYAQNATYTALDQPLSLTFGNNVIQTWGYDPVMQRLQTLVADNDVLNRAYTYDNVGNVATIADNRLAQTQTFAYDARDRLTAAAATGGTTGTYDEAYTYDPLGNLTSKGATASPVVYAYPTGGPGVARPHAPTTIGGRAQAYDANGNLTGDQGRLALTWDAENQPLGVAATDPRTAPQSWGDGNCDVTSQTRATPGVLAGFQGGVAFARGTNHLLAALADGTVLACGANDQGQLGDGTTTASNVAVRVAGLTGVTAVAAGDSFSLALKADGTVWSWGFNGDGRLGDGTGNQHSTPVQVSGLTGVAAIAAGRDFGLAVKADGTVWAWGNNNSAHLGDGTTVHRSTPVQTVGLTGITAVAAGYGHSVARKNDGTAWAWGDNSSGQLGAGSSAQGYTPIQVSGLTNVTGVAAGDAHSLAVESDGTVWGWGSNNSGQIGAGLAVTRYTPVQLPGIATATAVAAGSAHSLALLADGTVRAWGDNTKGQLGDGTTNGSTTPVTVVGLQGVDRIAARGNGSLARPTTASEQYTYDADGQRVTRSTGGQTWLYLGTGAWEERLGANVAGPTGWLVRRLYTLHGRAVAQQADTPDSIGYPSGRVFLQGDHLGSVSVVTDNDRRALSRQDYTPWGEVRAGGVAQTTLDFTGQRKDGTGLLYYGARYYDPTRGRFLSPDSVVPGMASGKGGAAVTLGQDSGAALRPLAVDFHESGFAATLAREDAFTQAKGFRFQLSNREKQQGVGALWQWGPRNPQALDRYSYALNNPLRYTDPTGHDCFDAEGGGGGLCGGGGGGGEGGGEGGGGGGYSGGGGGGGGDSGEVSASRLTTYDDIYAAPEFDPANFQPIVEYQDTIYNDPLYRQLQSVEPGEWVKVYDNGWLDGEKVSYHYFRSPSGRVFNVKLIEGWSDPPSAP
jgi:RHS repeat-associated protein